MVDGALDSTADMAALCEGAREGARECVADEERECGADDIEPVVVVVVVGRRRESV